MATVAIALVAGVVAFVLLFPFSGVDTIPPQCLSLFGYGVPCGTGLSLVVAAATAGVVGSALWLKGRR